MKAIKIDRYTSVAIDQLVCVCWHLSPDICHVAGGFFLHLHYKKKKKPANCRQPPVSINDLFFFLLPIDEMIKEE